MSATDLLAVEDIELEREICSRSFHEFIPLAWPSVEPTKDFVDNWHIGAICEHLEAVIDGQINRLVINVPPGTMKSLSVCVFFPAWTWGPRRLPGTKFIFASYSSMQSPSFRDSARTRDLILSPFYQDRWGMDYRLTSKPSGKFWNNFSGWRMATTVQGGVTGEHADIQVVDDPIKPYEVSKSLHVTGRALAECLTWWNETMSSRLVDIVKSARIIIMQRLHDADLAGAVLKEGGYTHLMLPHKFERKRRCITSIGFSDPRTEEGELLFPARFPLEGVDQQAKEMGSRAARAQHQQDPILAEGNIIKGEWIQQWEERTLPFRWVTMIQSWDCAFKGNEDSDFVVGQVWGLAEDGKFYLLDQVRERMGLVDTCKAIKRMTVKWPKAHRKLIEDKANGPAVFDTLKKRVLGMTLVNPEGGKEARVHAMEPLWENGDVLIPPDSYEWVSDYIAELTGFPAKENDDQVDSTSQALIYFQSKSIITLQQAMEKSRHVKNRKIA